MATPTRDPPAVPISMLHVSANQVASAPPAEEPRSVFRWPIVLAVLALIVGGVLYFVPLDQFKFASATPAIPKASRTLTVRPGLIITCTSAEPIQFTAARLHRSGPIVPCMRGWLGATAGNLTDHLDAAGEADPFKDSTLRFRFVVAKPGLKALTLSCNEGDPSVVELDKADGVAEYTYTGGTLRLLLTVEHGRVVLASAVP